MAIDRINISSAAIDRAHQSHGTEEVRSSEQSRRTNSTKRDDAVSLSSAAKDAVRMSNLVEQSRADRLEAVREAIANGTYDVSGAQIAEKMIELNRR